LKHGRELFAQHPITQLALSRDEPYQYDQDLVEAFCKEPWLAQVTDLQAEVFPPLLRSMPNLRELAIDRMIGEPDPELVGSLESCPSLARLERLACPGSLDRAELANFLEVLEGASRLASLELPHSGIDAECVRAFLRRPAVTQRLTAVDLSDNPLLDEGVRALSEWPCRLRSLDLQRSLRNLGALSELLGATCTSELTELSLDMEYSGDDAEEAEPDVVRAVAASPFWSRAESLTLRWLRGASDAMDALFEGSVTPRLRHLDLARSDWRSGDMALLANAPFSNNLLSLSLAGNGADDEDMKVIAASGRFTRLRTLIVAGNVGTKGAKHLANARELTRLRRLVLGSAKLTTASVLALLESPTFQLSRIELADCSLAPSVAVALARSARLARLEVLDLSDNEALGDRVLLPLAESPFLSPRCQVDTTGVPIAPEVADAFAKRRASGP
jgi:Ran GTPase-activating protein (RanGAP) involved in mRNA processing and transport